MHRNVEVLIGRLATDATLRKQFAGDATAVLRTLAERGLELTNVEIEALAAIEPNALNSFASSLDRRLCRAMTETTNHREEPMNTRNSLCQRPTSGAARITTVLFGLFSLATVPASAQWTITPYMWATDLGVDVSVHDQTVVDQTIGFTDLVKDLDMAAQLRVEGQFGHLGVMADLFDVRLSSSSGQIAMPDGAVATLDSRIRMTLLDVGGMFDPDGSPTGFAFFYGARILVQSAEVDASLQVDPSMAVPASSDESDTLVDALVGWRYTRTVGSGWALETQGDVTTGGTKLTWSVGGRIARSFGSRYTVSAGYRQMSIQFKDEPPVQVGMEMSGLMIGVGIGL